MGNEELKNAKVGDAVFVVSRWGKCLEKIEKITPKGYLRVGGTLYHQNGSERGGGDAWYKTSLKIATPEEAEEHKKQMFVKDLVIKLHNMDFGDIDYETAKIVNEILFEKNEEEKDK